MRKLIVALVVLPLAAAAQGPGPGTPGRRGGPPDQEQSDRSERSGKRMRLARTLGLAEALDLDTPQALKLGDALEKFDARREGARRQMHDARQALRRAASGENKVVAAEVDKAIQQLFDARSQLQAADREMLQAITRDLPPEKRARAALFLGRFEDRIERHVFRMGRPGERGMRGGMGPRGGGLSFGGPDGHAFRMRIPGPEEDQLEICMDEGCDPEEMDQD
jgi:hypothetical protein